MRRWEQHDMTNQLFGEGFDGLHGLRRRERTRLWYRAIRAAESETLPDNAASSAGVVEGPASAEEDGFSQQEIDAFFDEWAADLKAMRAQTPAELTPEARQQRILRRLGECAVVPEADVEIVAAPRTRQRVGISGWRNVPIN